MTVYPYDPEAHARRTDPDTSHEAARRLRPGAMMRRILAAYAVAGPMISDEAVAYCGYNAGAGAWKRVSDLTGLGYLRFTGDRRLSYRTNRMQMVREITDAGRKALDS